jgi:ParB-like chromosome segregation protein Spo0J
MAEEKARDPTKPEIKPVSIPLSKIHDLPGSVFAPPSPKSLEALTSSIVLKGVQEPVILRQREDGEFQIVSGNRRRKASELAKKTEIPAFIYDMTEKEARDFRLRGNAKGAPPGKLLPESEIGKKREAPAKTSDKAAENKTPVTQPKPSEKAAAVKPAPAPEPKKSEEKLKEAAPAEKSDVDSKVSVTPLKPPEKNAELKPAPEQKKPEDTPKTAAPTEKIDADGKKPDVPLKPPKKATVEKPAPTPALKQPEEKPKAVTPAEKTGTDGNAPIAPPKSPEKVAEVKPAPAVMPGPAALGPTGTKITKIFEDRLLPPDEKAMKDLPIPSDGESYFITLHPSYLEKSELNTVSVDVSSDDYMELKKSIELNGVKEPVLTRINPKGGLEILSGQRRHMIAREFNYPVPAIIQKIDDNDAMILVADSNLHRPHISTYDLSRTLRNKMTAMKRKAGRKKRGVPGADELQSDAMLAKEMGISTSRLNRIIRLSEATKAVCDAVDDNSLELSIASDLSFLSPEHQNAVIDLMGLNLKPTVKRVQRLRDAEKRGNLNDKTMRAILEDKDIQPVKPPEPPKPAPTQPDPPFPVASMVTPNVSPAPAPTTGTSPVTLAPPNMKPVMPEPPKQENTARPPATQTVEKPETAPTSASNVIPISAESKQPGDSKAADDEPIEFNSPRENLYSLKITLGGDRLRRYFPDVTMPALAITESIYSALEERRQREARMKQKTEILHPGKPAPTR